MTITYIIENKLYINITNKCQNSCEFCVRNNFDNISGSDPLWLEREPAVNEIIDDIKKHDLDNFSEIVFCGFGEPTMRLNDMLEVIREIKKCSDITIRLNTNGLSDITFGEDTSSKMAGLIDILSISLNASTPEKYDEICHSDFGIKALPAILKFTKSAVKVIPTVIMSVVDSIGEDEIEKCRELCNQTGAEFRIRSFIS